VPEHKAATATLNSDYRSLSGVQRGYSSTNGEKVVNIDRPGSYPAWRVMASLLPDTEVTIAWADVLQDSRRDARQFSRW